MTSFTYCARLLQRDERGGAGRGRGRGHHPGQRPRRHACGDQVVPADQRLRRPRGGRDGRRLRRRGAAPARPRRPEHGPDHQRHRRPVDRPGHPQGPDRVHGGRRPDRRPGSLVVTASSSNTALVPNGGIAFGGSGASPDGHADAGRGPGRQHDDHGHGPDGSLSAHDSFVLAVDAAGCADDGREPDDSIATAKPITSGVPVVGTACDDDYSALSVVAGQTINAVLAFTNANGDLDLRLYGPAGTLLGHVGGARRRRAHHLRPGRRGDLRHPRLPARRRREPQRLHADGHGRGRDPPDLVGPVAIARARPASPATRARTSRSPRR